MASYLWRSAAVAVLILGGLEYGCSSSSKSSPKPSAAAVPEAATPATPGQTMAADFTLKDSNGADIKLADYRGKVVLLNFWATWCGPCKVEIPWFIEFNKTYKDRGFTVLGISMDDDGWKSVKPYITQKQFNYPVMIGNDQLTKLYGGVDSLPTSFVIDRSGKIAFTHMGLEGKDVYTKEIESLLGNRTVAMN
jgi:cytochrome c biogenesis protein CcmG/thiol:disulfide interchange protein DsbE